MDGRREDPVDWRAQGPLLSTYSCGFSAGGRGSVPEPEAADLGALRGRRHKSLANSCYALSHPLSPTHTLFCSLKSGRSGFREFSVGKIFCFLGRKCFRLQWWPLARSSVSFGECVVGCRSGVVTTGVCRHGSDWAQHRSVSLST